MNKLVMQYYSLSSGVEPSEENYNRTLATAEYLKDNHIDNARIFKLFKLISKQKIEGEDMPNTLWENSLLEKGKFYYHNEFHITSKPPMWNPKTFKEECEPFFIEMKIKYTMDDLIERFYDKCRVPVGCRNDKQTIGGMNHLLYKYIGLKAPAIDYIMIMIDLANRDTEAKLITNVFDLNEYFKEAYIILEKIVDEATISKSNKIIWRNKSEM